MVQQNKQLKRQSQLIISQVDSLEEINIVSCSSSIHVMNFNLIVIVLGGRVGVGLRPYIS